jgi:hypothetical protein
MFSAINDLLVSSFPPFDSFNASLLLRHRRDSRRCSGRGKFQFLIWTEISKNETSSKHLTVSKVFLVLLKNENENENFNIRFRIWRGSTDVSALQEIKEIKR